MEINQYFGSDINLNQNSKIDLVSGDLETMQRIYRRLLTPVNNYLWDLEYGAGIPQYIGENLTPSLEKLIKGRIRTNMYLESTVSHTPEPSITLTEINNGIQCFIEYKSNATKNVYTLSFTVQN